MVVDDAFRGILTRDGAESHNQELLRIMHLNDGAEFTLAIKPAMRLCEQAPTFSEAFHQLAIAHHGLDDFENADRAYRACLWHCRYHYMAWAGMSECRRVAGDNRRALKMLRRAISISPDFEAARIAARSLNDEIQRMDETSDDR